jgi:hypothetical protein
MKKIENENIVAYDVDDTLVMWDDLFDRPHANQYGEDAVAFFDPYDGSTNYLFPHYKHVNLLKKHKGRGCYVRVWSAAGVKWAESVIKTLGLEEYVDSVETKPSKYVDDLPSGEILGSRIYLRYKKGSIDE